MIEGFIALFALLASAVQQQTEYGYQSDLMSDQQDFSAAEAEKDRQWKSYQSQYNQMLNLGFNPNLAASSLMGGSSAVGQSVAAVSPNIPNVNSIAPEFANLLGGTLNNYFQNLKQKSEIENLDSMTSLNRMELIQRPMNYETQRKLAQAQSDEAVSKGLLNRANADLVAQQALWVGPLSEAQVQQYQASARRDLAQAKLFAEEEKESKKKQKLMQSEIEVNEETVSKLQAEEQYLGNLSSEAYQRSVSLSKDNMIREKFLNDFPASMDFKDRVYNLAISPDENDRKEAQYMIDEILKIGAKEYKQGVENRFDNFLKESLMNLGNGLFNFVPAIGGGFGAGFGYRLGLDAATPARSPVKGYNR